MLLNCIHCGKTVSSNMDNCPYCKLALASTKKRYMPIEKPKGFKENLKSTLSYYIANS